MTTFDMPEIGREARNRRLDTLIAEAYTIYDRAVAEHITNAAGRYKVSLAATAVLFSGGNDSTILAHLFRHEASHAIHANTGIGIEATRRFVRDQCARWGLSLIEKHAPAGSTYEELVIERGFPGPAQHWKMYQRLKERALYAATAELIGRNYYSKRVVFLAGRRRSESDRRASVPEVERRRSVIWVSPLANWTPLDMNTYRMRYPDCPRNEVADLIHMSGECLCGAFAKPGELDEIGLWFPEVVEHIHELEAKARAAGVPEQHCRWGWGADRKERPSKTGPMCSSCTLFDLGADGEMVEPARAEVRASGDSRAGRPSVGLALIERNGVAP